MDIQKNGNNAFFVSNDEIFSAVTGRIAKNITYTDDGAIVSDATTGREEFFIPDFKQSGGSADTSDATAIPSDVSAGVTFYGAEGKETGTMPDVTATKSGNVVTVPAGRVRTEQKVTVGTAKVAATYTPGTEDQAIAAGTYLTGKQTIKGDSDLTAKNIKVGVSVFNVAGTFTADADATADDIAEGKTAYVNGQKLTGTASATATGSAELYKCASVSPETGTWSGYLTVLSDGMYSFSDTLTTGLQFGGYFTPEVGGIYDNGCTLSVGRLFLSSEVDFGAYSNFSEYGEALISASFSTTGKDGEAFRPYRSSVDSNSFVTTGPTEKLKSWSRAVINDAAYGIKPVEAVVCVHNYTDLDHQFTVTSMVVEGSNDMNTWDELGRQDGVNDTGEWTIICTPKKTYYKALRIVFTSAQEGAGAVLWKVRYSGIYYKCDEPTASPYNPSGLESNGYTITCSFSWWDDERPWKAFNFGVNAAGWGSDTSDNGVGQWIAWESETEKCIKRYQLRPGFDNRGEGFALQGYNEASGQWVTIDERVADSSDGVLLFDCSSNTGKYKKHRIICTAMESGAHFQLANIAAWE